MPANRLRLVTLVKPRSMNTLCHEKDFKQILASVFRKKKQKIMKNTTKMERTISMEKH